LAGRHIFNAGQCEAGSHDSLNLRSPQTKNGDALKRDFGFAKPTPKSTTIPNRVLTHLHFSLLVLISSLSPLLEPRLHPPPALNKKGSPKGLPHYHRQCRSKSAKTTLGGHLTKQRINTNNFTLISQNSQKDINNI
ncbi:MAG: hypothetical protein ABIK28_04025, partial [Planctomycetota bacterium]